MNFEKWMKIKRNLSKNTIKTYLAITSKIKGNINEAKVLRLIENKDNNTRRVAMFALICYLDYLKDLKKIRENFLRKYKIPKSIRRKRIYVSHEEVLSIHENYFDDNYLREKRTKQSIDLMFYFGLRTAELLSLKRGDVQNGYLCITGKGNKIRSLPIPKIMSNKYGETLDKIEFEILADCGYSTIRKDISSACKAGGLRQLNPHSFRHGYASLLLSKGVDLLTISTLLGHTSLDTTAIYLHLEPINIKNKIEAIF